MEATRQLYWNIDGKGIMYFFALLCLVIFSVGFCKKFMGWHLGRPSDYRSLPLRVKTFLPAILRHDSGIFRGTFRKVMHLGVFYGFILLIFGTFVIAIQDHFGIPLFYGKKYLILSLLLDLFGFYSLLGIGMAAYKRYIDKPDHDDYTLDDAVLLILIASILFTGFVLEGFRIYATRDPWAWWSPVGLLFSILTQKTGLSVTKAIAIYGYLWYGHMLLAFGFIAYIPYSKLFHMFASALTLFNRSFSPIGGLTPVGLLSQTDRHLGVNRLQDFTQKQLVELDACISCGRCQKGCPAYQSGSPLSPKVVLQSLKRHDTLQRSWFRNRRKPLNLALIDQVISQETLMACTTCGLCEDKCPISILHISRIVDLRRSIGTEGNDYPLKVQTIFQNISTVGNPWGENVAKHNFLEKEWQIPLIQEKGETDILYWVGCFGAYQSRNLKISQVMFKILEKAGINYAILGSEEKCCGDSVRRLGNEKLFQQLALEAIHTLNRYKFKTILTHCPHCYNTLKNEYPEFGGHFEVIHHSEYLFQLIKSGKLKLQVPNNSRVTFHDPCYLGRYNGIYEAPREILSSIQGLELVEMKNNRSKAFCCGAGGGRIWLEPDQGKFQEYDLNIEQRINDLLVKKALRTEADVLVSACSLCLASLTEAVSRFDTNLECLDIAELVYSSL